MKNILVTVNYNDYDTTKKLIDNVINYSCIELIIVVDNNSTDNSLRKLNQITSSKVKVISSSENKGYSAGLNIGCKYAIDKYKECNLIISNADILIDNEFIIKDLVKELSDKNVIVAPNIIEDNKLNRGWHIPTISDDIILNLVYFGKKHFNNKLRYKDSYYKNKLSKVETVSGCFFLITSKHLIDINYFDENVFLYYEENIFGIKTKKLNKNIIIVNDVDVVHDHAKTIDKSIKKIKKYDIQKKSQYYFEKEYNHASKFNLIILKLVTIITRIILSIKYLFD